MLPVVVFFAALLSGASASDGLLLVQRSVMKVDVVPTVSLGREHVDVVAGIRAASDVVVSSLQSSIETMRVQDQATIRKEVSEFEANLTSMERDIRLTEKANAKMACEVIDLTADVVNLRNKARSLIAENEQIRADVRKAAANLTLAKEFTATLLNRLAAVMEYTDTSVLGKLAEEEEERQAAEDRLQRMEEVRRGGNERPALLQVGRTPTSAPAKMPKDANSMLESMASSLDALEAAQNATKATVRATYVQALATSVERVRSLQEEGALLNATAFQKNHTKFRLVLAVRSLNETHTQLLWGRGVLLRFMKRRIARIEETVEQGTMPQVEQGTMPQEPRGLKNGFAELLKRLKASLTELLGHGRL